MVERYYPSLPRNKSFCNFIVKTSNETFPNFANMKLSELTSIPPKIIRKP